MRVRCWAFPERGGTPRLHMIRQSVFACDLGALSAEERRRLTTHIAPLLKESRREVEELEDGYEIRFLDGRQVLPLVAEWLSMEGRCCPFFNLSMWLPANDGPLTVRITGDEGVKTFILDELPGIVVPTSGGS